MKNEGNLFDNQGVSTKNSVLFSGRTNFNLEKTNTEKQTAGESDSWQILIVDDEKDIHTVIKLALDDFSFQNKKLHFLDAFSGKEAMEILKENPQIALILLDVVMETNNAGLQLVKHIREELENQFIRIILWTGQAGQAPEREVIEAYEINDYKTKTELTADKLFTVVMAGLRTYQALMTVENYRKNLEKKVKERTLQIEKQKEELQQNNATKNKFFRIIAHDLKNPFSALLSISSSLSDSFDELDKEEQLFYIQRINKSANSLYELLQNLLQWAKSQTGEMPFEPRTFKIDRLIGLSISVLKMTAEKKKIRITHSLSNDLMAHADYNMINSVLQNLIYNAIKFTPEHGEIRISTEKKAEQIQVSISDTGMGICPENLKKLFKTDTYYSTKGTANETGTGLGLIICKEFIRKNGGDIFAQSIEKKGSTFSFHIPCTDEKAGNI